MKKLFGYISQSSWSACALCAILSILAVPQSAKAETYEECQARCMSMFGGDPQAYSNCMADCDALFICGGNCTSQANCAGDLCNPI